MYLNEIAVKNMANDDKKYIIDLLRSEHDIVTIKDFTVTKVSDASIDSDEIEYNVKLVLDVDNVERIVEFQYYLQPDGIVELSEDLDDIVNKIDSKVISNSTSSSLSKILAADDFDSDDFEEITPEPSPDELSDDNSISDTLDDMSDTLDDLQDHLDDSDIEDDINIDINNNIDNHYVAECEKCHGIFISSMIESDQPTESIHGTCPLCDKESDQYLKWVVKAVEQ